jgi:hypothetical protein
VYFFSGEVTLEPSSSATEYTLTHNSAQVCYVDTLICSTFLFFRMSFYMERDSYLNLNVDDDLCDLVDYKR